MKNRTLFLIIESIKNPKKFFCVLYKKLFSIPSLEFLRKIKSKKIKSLYLNFWFFFSKKNNNFKKICFNASKINKKRVFTFNKNKLPEEEIIDSLSSNGIVVIEDILVKKNLQKLISLIDELKQTPYDLGKNSYLQKAKKKYPKIKKERD